jgi:hypothetical protein
MVFDPRDEAPEIVTDRGVFLPVKVAVPVGTVPELQLKPVLCSSPIPTQAPSAPRATLGANNVAT